MKERANTLENQLNTVKSNLLTANTELRITKEKITSLEREIDNSAGSNRISVPSSNLKDTSISAKNEEILQAQRKQNDAEAHTRRVTMELESALANQRMAEEHAASMKSSFETKMKDLSRKNVTLMTENSRLSADLEALRSRADLVGELESQVNAFKMNGKNLWIRYLP